MIELKFTVNNCSLPRMNGCPAAIIIVLLFLQTAFCHETNCFLRRNFLSPGDARAKNNSIPMQSCMALLVVALLCLRC